VPPCCSEGGVIIIVAQFNDYPVDAIVRWSYSGTAYWNRGLNLFSKKTLDSFLEKNARAIREWNYERFFLPFDLKKQDDPIRTWTEKDSAGQRIFKNGLNMEINLQLLSIKLKT